MMFPGNPDNGEFMKLTSQEIIDLSREYTFFSWSVQAQVNPIPVGRAEGVYFWDTDGKRYIDFSSQLMNTNIGHQHPKVVKAIQDQAAQICFVHPGNTTEVRAQLGKKLAEVTPGNLKKTFFALVVPKPTKTPSKLPVFTPDGTKSWPATARITAQRTARLP